MKNLNIQYKQLVFNVIAAMILNVSIVYNCFASSDIDSNKAKVYYDSAKSLYNSGQYHNAIKKLDEALKLKKSDTADNYPEYYRIYNRCGIVYYSLGFLQQAVENYNLALKGIKDEYIISIINGNIANVYLLKGDYLKAINYYENSLIALQNSSNKNKYQNISENFNNQGNAYFKLGDYNTAIVRYKQGIEIAQKYNSKEGVGDTYYNCGIAYERLKSLEQAKDYYNKAIQITMREYGKYNVNTTKCFMALAGFYVNISDYNKASRIYSTIYNDLKKSVGEKHPYISQYYRYMGEMHYKMGNYQKALVFYQDALKSKIYDFDSDLLSHNPSSKVMPDIELLDILKGKAKALVKISGKENKEGHLKIALSTLELTVKFIEQLRAGYLFESSKLELAEKEHETYMSIIEIASALLETTGDNKYFETAFQYSEKSKYAILRELRNEEMAKNLTLIPDSIRLTERNIQRQIGELRFEINNLSKSVNYDSLKIEGLKKELFLRIQTRESIVHNLEINYPQYYKLKFKNKVVDVTGLEQVLSKQGALISYELTDSLLYIFFVSKDKHYMLHKQIDSTFYHNLSTYVEFMQSEYSLGYAKFRKSSFGLYRVLIEPVEKDLKHKNLLIVPDNELSFISFESLTTEPYEDKMFADYRDEPYLLRKYPVGYAYSATLFEESKRKEKTWNPRFLGIAPDYKDNNDSLSYFSMVPKELKRASRLFKGKILTGNGATEENVKKNIKNYGILHFYAHGFDNKQTPSLSKIILTQTNNSTDDGNLYAYEVSELGLNAELIVLASCYSGSGAINPGEGTLSIGRSFMVSGSSSIIYSLSLAYVEPSLKELKEFYKQLVFGKRKDEALRIAKLKYLESASFLDANPKYWNSLIVVGNQDALFRGYLLKIVFIPLGLVFFILYFFRKRKLRVKLTFNKSDYSD